jgi:DNA polymerase-4
MTESLFLFGNGREIAEKIRQTVKEELHLTVSIGVSFNKVFAKLASELKKPDAVTEITRENYKTVVWPLPVTELLFVGKSTAETLRKIGVKTIGDLAKADEELVNRFLGKRGRQLRVYARGEDQEPVKTSNEKEDIKSIGNSMTLPQDIHDREEIKRWFYVLSESVASRLRDADVGKANTVHIVVRNTKMQDTTCQMKVTPTILCGDIAKAAFDLYCAHFPIGTQVRMLGVTVSGFDYHIEQLSLDSFLSGGETNYEKRERAESAIAKLRDKYGYATVQRGVVLEDDKLSGLDIRGKKEDTNSSKGDE